jgi:hypothetical protein
MRRGRAELSRKKCAAGSVKYRGGLYYYAGKIEWREN